MKAIVLLSTLLSSTVVASSSNDIVQHLTDLQQRTRRAQEVGADPCTSNNGELLSVRAFYEGTLGQCQCTFSNDLTDLENFDQDSLGDPETNPDFIGDVVDLINDLLRSLSYSYANSCAQSGCETCFGAVCGTITASEGISVEGKSGTCIFRVCVVSC